MRQPAKSNNSNGNVDGYDINSSAPLSSQLTDAISHLYTEYTSGRCVIDYRYESLNDVESAKPCK